MKLNDFVEKLGSTSPTPGGGAASGLNLALAGACCEKAARFSLGEDLKHIIESFEKYRNLGLKLCEMDQIAFDSWQKAKKLPKDNDEQKRERDEKIRIAVNECAKVPLSIAEFSYKLLNEIEIFLPNCNKFLVSDVACGISFAKSAFETSIFNIKINLPYIKDNIFSHELKQFIIQNYESFMHNSHKLLEQCNKILDS